VAKVSLRPRKFTRPPYYYYTLQEITRKTITLEYQKIALNIL